MLVQNICWRALLGFTVPGQPLSLQLFFLKSQWRCGSHMCSDLMSSSTFAIHNSERHPQVTIALRESACSTPEQLSGTYNALRKSFKLFDRFNDPLHLLLSQHNVSEHNVCVRAQWPVLFFGCFQCSSLSGTEWIDIRSSIIILLSMFVWCLLLPSEWKARESFSSHQQQYIRSVSIFLSKIHLV